ncbi:hypothetical protein [Caballeronia cordobensis]|uniref:hypothetical protein n=1 Tax=Caballeronia cordobensis TaxID=1353886 RepID=UPI000A521632|nr:hypothetical protein [Caballeronia cordobensis]
MEKQIAHGGAQAPVDSAPNTAVFSASVHPATVALVRQELKLLLATNQFLR